MDIPVGKQPDEVNCPALVGTMYNGVPDVGLKNPSCFKCRIDKACTLVKDPASPHGVVTHFAVSHIII